MVPTSAKPTKLRMAEHPEHASHSSKQHVGSYFASDSATQGRRLPSKTECFVEKQTNQQTIVKVATQLWANKQANQNGDIYFGSRFRAASRAERMQLPWLCNGLLVLTFLTLGIYLSLAA
ncbi:hypothetical protein AHF37_11699 [Paragonimus kellicotti]|nr:hypothetical protein AHF37_11699 [Paragonimus kellicotti]